MFRTSAFLFSWLLAITGPAERVPVTLAGSPESMERQHRIAIESGYDFLRTPVDVRRAVRAGELVRVSGNESFAVNHPDDGFARPELRDFIQRFSADYRAACGERLVVTSLVRPLTRQPRNAHPLSVHPVGMAMDLRVPRRAICQRWLEKTLLELEERGVLDVTRERRPAHYHVALFPEAYLAHLGLDAPGRPEVVAIPAAMGAAPMRAIPKITLE